MTDLVQIKKHPTRFASQEVDFAGFKFTLDGNSKVTAGNGSFEEPAVNSFSLRHVLDCPQATETCKSTCYVHGLKANKPALWDAYERNAMELRRMLDSSWRAQVDAANDFGWWIRDNAPAGFRWHVSGDIISKDHADWIGGVSNIAGASAWIYTRSFSAIANAEEFWYARTRGHLAVNLSADEDNYTAARRLHDYMRCIGDEPPRICYLTLDGTFPDDLPDGSVIFPSYELRGDQEWWRAIGKRARRMVCPPDFFGQSRSLRCGPCRKCL